MLSNHFLTNINVSVSAKVISYRKYKSIDKDAFLANLQVSSLVLDPPDDVDQKPRPPTVWVTKLRFEYYVIKSKEPLM